MVFLVVKGTVYPDEFMVERRLSDALATSATPPPSDSAHTAPDAAGSSPTAGSSIVPAIAHTLNARHQLRCVLMSAQELAKLYAQNHEAAEETAQVGHYTARVEELYMRLKDTTSPVRDGEFDEALVELRAMTSSLYPALCTHADGVEAAIEKLYAQHDDPDLDEDTRLLVYHCRAIVDPQWKAGERVKEEEAALWFCGKPMDGTLAKYAGRNEKSKVIVKVAPRGGPAPSGEPRMRYEDQRALFNALRQRRETYKQLEESELRDRVVQQARGAVRLSAGSGSASSSSPSAVGSGLAASGAAPTLRTDRLRPIYPSREERELPIS